MLLQPLTVVAGLLALPALPAAQAFLIPPEVSDADIQIANTIESIAAHVPDSQVVDVDCPSCPVLVRGRHGRPIQVEIDRPTHLQMTFSIDHASDHDRLLVNGFELYPHVTPLHKTLLAPQVVDLPDKEKRHFREHDRHDRERKGRRRFEPQPQRLGFGLHVEPAKKDADGKFELVEVELQVIEVGPAFVDGVPNLRVKLIKDAEGRLLLSQIIKGQPNKLAGLATGSAAQCTTSYCRWMVAVKEKLKSFKAFGNCHGGAMKGGMRPPVMGEAPGPNHHHPLGDHWRAPYQERRWGTLLQYIGSHILLPVFVGIVAGVSISLIGMAVGTVIVSLWRAVFRRRSSSHHRSHRRRHSHRKAALKEAALVEEKSGLMEHQDPPPAYEDEEPPKAPQA